MKGHVGRAWQWMTSAVPAFAWGFLSGVVGNRVGVEMAILVAAIGTALFVLRSLSVQRVIGAFVIIGLGAFAATGLPTGWLTPRPIVELRLADDRPLEGKRLKVQIRKFGSPESIYEFTLDRMQMKEIGCRVETKLSVIRLYLEPAGLVSQQMQSEPSDDPDFKSVLRVGTGQPLNACDRQTVYFSSVWSYVPLPSEIGAALKVYYGPPTPAVSHFTIVPGPTP